MIKLIWCPLLSDVPHIIDVSIFKKQTWHLLLHKQLDVVEWHWYYFLFRLTLDLDQFWPVKSAFNAGHAGTLCRDWKSQECHENLLKSWVLPKVVRSYQTNKRHFSRGRTTAETQDVKARWASWMFLRWNRVILQYFAGQQSERQLMICIDAWFTVECFGTSPKCETSCGGKQSNLANWVLSVVGIGARSPACSKKHQSILFIWADGGESLARLEASCNGTGRFQDSNNFRCQVHPSHVANQSWKTCTLKLQNVQPRAPMWWDSDKFRLLSQVEGDLIQAWKILRCFAKNNACCMLLDSSVRLGGSKLPKRLMMPTCIIIGIGRCFGTEDYLFTFFTLSKLPSEITKQSVSALGWRFFKIQV